MTKQQLREAYANHPTQALVTWNLADPDRDFLAVSGAWSGMEHYHAAAGTQIERIWDSFRKVQEVGPRQLDPDGNRSWIRHHQQAFADIHFYFTCWAQVRLMMLVVVNRSGLPRIGMPKEHKKILDHYRDGRSGLAA